MDDKLKILETMDVYLPDVDGVINCMHNYCLNLKDKTELSVLVPKNKKSYVDNLPYEIKRCKSMHIPVLNQYYGLPSQDASVKKYLDSKKFDIIHFHSPFGMAKYVIKYAKKHHIPVVATFHSDMRMIFRDVFKSKLIAESAVKSLGRVYNQCDEIFVCSPLVAEQARSYGYKGKITYLPFGTDLKICENVDELASKANESFDLDQDLPVFVHVGRVTKLKRIDFIIRSLKILKDKGKKFKFFVVGKGFELDKLKALVKKLDMEQEVVFTGFLARELFPQILSRANLLLFPSIYDNFGLVKVESAVYETPGIYIENTCAGYGINDGVDGFISKNTTEDFASKIEEAISDMKKLKEIGKTAQKTIYISWSECSDKLLERLTEIVKEKKSEDKK